MLSIILSSSSSSSSSSSPIRPKNRGFLRTGEMLQSKLNGFHGLPLCLSGITLSHPSLSTEMADHDRRREAMRRQRSSTSSAPERADRGIGISRYIEEEGSVEEIRERDGEVDGDLTNQACAARAA